MLVSVNTNSIVERTGTGKGNPYKRHNQVDLKTQSKTLKTFMEKMC